jgi:hypothetical protein
MTQLIRATTLALILSVCAQADGIMQTDKTPPPPKPSSAATQPGDEPTEAADVIIQTGLTEEAATLSLGLLQSVLAIL